MRPRMFTDAVREFLPWVEAEYRTAPASGRRIATSMTSCEVFFGRQMVSTIQPGDIERYKLWRLTPRQERSGGHVVEIPPVKPITLRHDLNNLSVFFQWAVKQDYARVNPLKDVDRPSDAGARRERVLTLEEERRYFAHARGDLADVARLILLQGFRPEEVLRMRKTDVDLDRGVVRIDRGKTAAARRTLRLTAEARSILARRLTARAKHAATPEASPWVFPSPRKPGAALTKVNAAHDRTCARCGVEFVLYDLPHTFATRMVEAGVDLVALRQILGHTDIRVTMRYVHPNQKLADAAMAVYDRLNEARRGEEVVN